MWKVNVWRNINAIFSHVYAALSIIVSSKILKSKVLQPANSTHFSFYVYAATHFSQYIWFTSAMHTKTPIIVNSIEIVLAAAAAACIQIVTVVNTQVSIIHKNTPHFGGACMYTHFRRLLLSKQNVRIICAQMCYIFDMWKSLLWWGPARLTK